MAREEFTKAVKVTVIKRATKDGKVFCEECGSLIKKWEIDHDIPDALQSETEKKLNSKDPSKAKLLCLPCHAEKTNKKDKPAIAKAKRREAYHLGVRNKPTLISRGFDRVEKNRAIDKTVLPKLPRKGLFQ